MANQQPQKKQKKQGKAASPVRTPAEQPGEESVFAHFHREIWGAVCLILAILVILSSFSRNSAMARIFTGMTGQAGLYVLPPCSSTETGRSRCGSCAR